MSDFLGLFSDDNSQNTENQNNQSNSSNQGNATSSTSQNSQQSSQQNSQNGQNDGTLQLHKEELDITKNSVDAGDVVISKDVVEEQKTVDVPVMHEEVVITRTPMNNERSDSSSISQETITIPVSQEQVEVNKYAVTTEEISASKRQVEETQQVQETLKREEAHVDTTGNVNVVSDESSFSDINNS
ncbi:YsnF/AvaK domain-containing protein [Neobacillus drentensis]|uniref:YsnF/AvaK domain-containing protein n=1 Tax=Neobacillus drentensis TaxID=220684 RepID=UPI001F1CB0F5|nr:YsnF/AvaK domain-containing protein [Neobacillus drentensis]ULT55054.1 YsnF/AvaK domain-containing protein [Neobacillus drentensis]